LQVAHLLKDVGADLSECGETHLAGVAVGPGGDRQQHDRGQQAEINAADDGIPRAFPGGQDHPQQDRVSGEQAVEIIGKAEHIAPAPAGSSLS
jgi:hypothetical protein